MKIVVLGAGVIGVCTAYYLRRQGHSVRVIDRQSAVGLETSFANGGQIAANHATPWAGPDTLPLILKWLGRRDAPLLYHLRLDPALWRWSLQFLRQCTHTRMLDNMARILRVALFSRNVFAELQAQTDIQYHRSELGILNIFTDEAAFRREVAHNDAMAKLGCERQVMDHRAVVDFDSAFGHATPQIVGGLYSPDDASGDAFAFTTQLAELAAKDGVQFDFDTDIHTLVSEHARIKAVQTSKGDVEGDAFVVCMGSYSPLLVRPLGLHLPIYPAKGYSLTLPIAQSDKVPRVSMTDDEFKLVFSRFGDRFRIAGTAEFTGYNTDANVARERILLARTMALFPDCADEQRGEYWAGLRPSTPDGVPVMGQSQIENLYFNTGHGTLGWTMAAGSGKALAEVISGHPPSINMQGLGPRR